MPDYYGLKDYHGADVDKPVPLGWRKCFPRFPYFTGQRVRLRLKYKALENHRTEDYALRQKLTHISEIVVAPLKNESKTKGEFEGTIGTENRISLGGDIAFYFCTPHEHGEPIFTAHAWHMDGVRWGFLFFFLGLISGRILEIIGWVLKASK